MKEDHYSTISEEEAKRLREAAAAFSVTVNEAIEKIIAALEPFYLSAGMTMSETAEALNALTARYFAVEEAQVVRKRNPCPCPTKGFWPRQGPVKPQIYAQTSPTRKRPRARSAIQKRGNRRRP